MAHNIRNKAILIKLSKGEIGRLRRAAKKKGLPTSTFIRQVALSKAG